MNETLLGILKNIAPALATAALGPAGGLVVKAISEKLGVENSEQAVTQALQANPELALRLKEIDTKQFEIEQNNITERLKADMGSDSWLSKNIRPMTLIFILFAYFIFAMMSAFGISANEKYVELLGQWGMLIMSFYFGGRTLEKIMDMKAKK
jgi:hypothetical protein